MEDKFFKIMFLIGSIWNVIGGIVIIILTPWVFSVSGIELPNPAVYYYSWIALFMTFGVGYFMIFRDMYGNKNIVICGIIGKLAFALIFIFYYIVFPCTVPVLFIIPVIGDLIFVILFTLFLLYARKK